MPHGIHAPGLHVGNLSTDHAESTSKSTANHSDVMQIWLIHHPASQNNWQDTIKYSNFSFHTHRPGARIRTAYSNGREMNRGVFTKPSPLRLAQSIFHPMKSLMRWVTETLRLHRGNNCAASSLRSSSQSWRENKGVLFSQVYLQLKSQIRHLYGTYVQNRIHASVLFIATLN